MIRLYTRNISVCSMWRSDEGVAPYRCLCQSKQTDKPKFEAFCNRLLAYEKKEAFASFGGISVFSPSVCRTASAGWEPGGRGSAGLRSSWVTFLSVIVLIRIVCRPARSAHTLSKNDTKNALYIDIDQYVWYNTQSRMFERSATPSVPITHGLTIHHMASELTAYIQPTAFMTKRIRRSS